MKNVKFKKWDCYVKYAQYSNGRLAIQLEENGTYEPIAVATINIPECRLQINEVIIKNYSENEGMISALLEAGIITEFVRTVKHGFVESPIYKIN
jgi:hypothetical protein